MAPIKAALLGFGTVGQGVYEALKTHKKQLESVFGNEVVIEAILVKDGTKKRDVDAEVLVTTDFDEILRIPDLQIVFEAIVGEEPGYTYLSKAIERGCHVITANKVMFAKYGRTLRAKAIEEGVGVGFEATTAGGTPIIRSISQLLQVNEIRSIEAILNGTSNYILTAIREKGLPFPVVLKTAQELGYAEADPVNDVEGYDAFYKLMILSELSFGAAPSWDTVVRQGITEVTQEQIELFELWGYRIKHLARIRKAGEQLNASVKPVLVDAHHPLYSVEGVQNAVTVETSLAGKVTIQGAGAGKLPTASAMVEDLTYVLQPQPFTLKLFKQDDERRASSNVNAQDSQQVLVVIGKEPLPDAFAAEVVKKEESAGLVYQLILCTSKAASELKSNPSFHIYEVASDQFEVVANLKLAANL
ncbi:homoserine dehydrogenase [Fictibacillus barbaricus]|uniref:Homoserine dehydrogenase n=1 Tax=Fictibacillus barbaricus TaxID=182136 RepID=A0ABU1TVV4_9BACL|nr:homoserine dehydrogenase [Fictibacillus barbaricus]MDR7071338.1 homoserine dehydrogenase [Fictibacillus barbaricus]